MNMHARRGFTLLELLVVVAIVGLLSAIIVAILSSARVSSRDTKRIADVKEIQTAMQFYYDKWSQYPAQISDLSPTYLPTVPKDPSTKAVYFYDQVGGGSSYHLGANLEDATNKALKSDRDIVTDTINGADGTVTTPSDCSGGSSSRLSCYDVSP